MRILLLTVVLACGASMLAGFLAEQMTSPIVVIPNVASLLLSHNPGIAFSIQFPSPWQEIIIVVALCAVSWMAYTSKDTLSRIAFGLIIGGALANLLDRLPDGFVTDFFRVGTFPVFNVADSCITIGAVLLIADSLFRHKTAVSRQK